jgi:hypothetical protein
MRKWILLGMLTGLAFWAGCATVTRTASENRSNIRSVAQLNVRQMADDWNLIWLNDRQSRLTRWHVR